MRVSLFAAAMYAIPAALCGATVGCFYDFLEEGSLAAPTCPALWCAAAFGIIGFFSARSGLARGVIVGIGLVLSVFQAIGNLTNAASPWSEYAAILFVCVMATIIAAVPFLFDPPSSAPQLPSSSH